MKPHTVPDNAPVPVLLACYRRLWEENPLWLVNLPGLPDALKEPEAARDAARAMIAQLNESAARAA